MRRKRKTALDETYQGWSNRETWHLNLHLGNDQGVYDRVQELARDALVTPDGPTLRAARDAYKAGVCRFAEALEAFVDELLDMDSLSADILEARMPAGLLYGDMITGFLARVDWDEIAAAWMEE